MGVFFGGGAKYGKGWCDIDPQRTRSYFSGFLRLCQFWWKSIKKCDHESARRRSDGQTHRQRHTDTQTQTDFIICPMLYAIAMGQIITLAIIERLLLRFLYKWKQTKMNTLQYTYLMARWRHKCVIPHVTKLRPRQAYLQYEMTAADCRFLKYIRRNRLFATFNVRLSQFLVRNFYQYSGQKNLLHFHRFSIEILSSECSIS